MEIYKILESLEVFRDAIAQRHFPNGKPKGKSLPINENILHEAVINNNYFIKEYCDNFKTSTFEYFETRFICESFILLKSFHNVIHDPYQINKIINLPSKDEKIQQTLSHLEDFIVIDDQNREEIIERLILDEVSFFPDELPRKQITDFLMLYRKNKNILDYIFYVNLKNIFSRHRKPYTRDLISFIKIFEESFPSALTIKFDLDYSEVENIRNRIRGYENKISPELADITKLYPLKL